MTDPCHQEDAEIDKALGEDWPVKTHTMPHKPEILARIQDYLGSGGLFNPEMMEHEKVRDLIMAARDHILTMPSTDVWGRACDSMARACLASTGMIRDGKSTLAEHEAWLHGCINNDAAYVLEQRKIIAEKMRDEQILFERLHP